MNIVILQDYLRSGGTERQSILLGRAFAAAGHATALVTFRPGGALWGTARPLEPRALQPFDLGLDWFAPGLGRAVRDLDPAIVLAMGRMANCRAGRLQRLLDRSERRGAVVATLRTGKPLPWLFRRSLRAVRHVVANSEEARERLTGREGLAAGQVTVIPNALVFPAANPGAGRPAAVPAGRGGADDRPGLRGDVPAGKKSARTGRDRGRAAARGPGRRLAAVARRRRPGPARLRAPGPRARAPGPGQVSRLPPRSRRTLRRGRPGGPRLPQRVAVQLPDRGAGPRPSRRRVCRAGGRRMLRARPDRLGDPGRRPGRLSRRPGSAARRAAGGPGRPRAKPPASSRAPASIRTARSGPTSNFSRGWRPEGGPWLPSGRTPCIGTP